MGRSSSGKGEEDVEACELVPLREVEGPGADRGGYTSATRAIYLRRKGR